MRLAVYGGSFNPVHNGHLLTALHVKEQFGYDKVLYVPANIPVHKDASDFPAAEHRYAMLQLAIAPVDFFEVSDIEIQRGGNSYTIDTIKELMNRYQITGKIGVIIGDDLVAGLPKWKEIDQLQDIAELLCLRRHLAPPHSPYHLSFFENRIIEISSTEIRDRVYHKRTIDFMVPDSVKNYIQEHHLYQ